MPMSGYRPLSAVVLAAGEGTRMRSAHAQGAAPAVRPPDAPPRARRARRAPARADRRRRRPRRRARHQDGPGAARRPTCRSSSSSSACSAAPATPSASRSPPSPTTSTLEDDVSSCPATPRCCGPRRWPARHRAPPRRRRRDAAHRPRSTTPPGYGRVVRDAQGRVDRIVEQTDATADELAIDEVNPSIYCFRRGLLAPALRRLSPENAQGEYYLTDVDRGAAPGRPPRARGRGRRPHRGAAASTTAPSSPTAEAELRARINDRWMRDGRHDDRPRAHLHRHRRSSSSPTCACSPARSSRAAPSSARGSVIGPDTQLVDTIVGERRGRPPDRRARGRDRRRRAPSARTCRCGRAPASPPARTSARSSR